MPFSDIKLGEMGKKCCFCNTEEKSTNGLFKISSLMKEQLRLKKDVLYFICLTCLSAGEESDEVMHTNKECPWNAYIVK